MQPKNDIPAAVNYAGTGETRARDGDPDDSNTAAPERTELGVLVELVVVYGPEGQKLHAIQAEVIYRILTRMAERQIQTL
jgi:hypothetical protein